MNMLSTFVRRFAREEQGAALAEYAAIFLVLAVAGTAIDTWLNANVTTQF